MKAYRRYLTVTDTKQIVLDDLPFEPGQRVEVLVLANGEDREEAIRRLERALQDTQALAEANGITDKMIAEEIEAYRSEHRMPITSSQAIRISPPRNR
ncbi:MAG: hypothetical protein U0641_14210 [Anaerolineae bacterium]